MVPSLFLSFLRYALYDIIVLLLISNYVLVNVSCFIWGGGGEGAGMLHHLFVLFLEFINIDFQFFSNMISFGCTWNKLCPWGIRVVFVRVLHEVFSFQLFMIDFNLCFWIICLLCIVSSFCDCIWWKKKKQTNQRYVIMSPNIGLSRLHVEKDVIVLHLKCYKILCVVNWSRIFTSLEMFTYKGDL